MSDLNARRYAPVYEGRSGLTRVSRLSDGLRQRQHHGSGIVWASLPGREGIDEKVGGLLAAHDADTLNEIWTSEQNSARDRVGHLASFVPPVVANGRVYMANMDGSVIVYGPLPPPLAQLSALT